MSLCLLACRLLPAASLLLLLSGCGTSPAVEAALNAPLVIPDAVQQVILEQAKFETPARLVQSMASTEVIEHRSNLGSTIQAKATYRHALTPQGLLDAVVSVDVRDGASTGASEGLSLCGLVVIASAGGAKITSSTTTAIPFGKLFLPASFANNTDRASSGRLSALSVKSGRVCAPAAGETFEFSAAFEMFYRVKGTITLSGTRETVQEVRCTAAVGRLPAAALGFEGDYLPVHCEMTDTKNQKTAIRDYAFLDGSRMYVLLSAKSDWQNSSVTYREVVYAP